MDQTEIVSAQKNVSKLINNLNRLMSVAQVAFGVGFITSLLKQADAYSTLANRIATSTNSAAEAESAQAGLVKVAMATYRPLEDVVHLFQRYSLATENLQLSQEDLIGFTKQVTQATVLSGASAEETHGALIQLAQGLSSNFQSAGQEIQSIIEQAPMVAKIIARSIDPSGAKGLKQLSREGLVTAKQVVKALREAGPELDRLMSKRTPLFADLVQNGITMWRLLTKQLMPAFDAFKGVLQDVSKWIMAEVKSGGALNSVIAALIIGVGALTAAFGPFLLAIALPTAALAALYLIIQDIVTFANGGDSILGRIFDKMFGAGGAQKARDGFLALWETAKLFFKFISNPSADTWKPFYDSAVVWIVKIGEVLKATLRSAVLALSEAIGSDQTLGPLVWLAKKLAPKSEQEVAAEQKANDLAQGKAELESGYASRDQMLEEGKAELEMRRGGSWWDKAGAAINGGVDSWLSSGDADTRLSGGGNPLYRGAPSVPFNGEVSHYDSGVATVINNSVVVQGNADASVTRDMVERMGSTTVQSLGRDRSAIGAGVGLRQ